MAKEAAIGIDLGTTYSAVGVCLHGKVEIIANNQGSRLTPSMVSFTKDCRLVGEAADQQKNIDPENTIYDAKRMIGRKYEDPLIQQDLAYWPFKVENVGGRPMIEVQYRNKPRMLTPEEISAMVLQRMKETAEAYLGYKVKDAVITVPAYFNDSQRQATRVAGQIAGLNVIRVLNEPTAAAIAFGLDKESLTKGEMNVVVYDLGGGTFDVSVLTIDGDSIQVRGTAGDTHLGGEDFDNRLLDYLADDFAYAHGRDLGSNKRALRRLKTAVEQAKRALSAHPEASIELDALHEGLDYRTKLSRAKFEELCADLFEYTMKTVDLALSDAGLDKTDIEEVILVGGCTRIPKIREMLQEFFKVSELNSSMDPEEAVAAGAAIEAAFLNDDFEQNRVLVDVNPLTLGIESSGGLMTPIIPRGTQLPAHVVHKFTTNVDDQTSVTVKIFQGERAMTRDNQLLGMFDLTGIQPAPRGVKTIDVKFDLSFDGILSVAAIEPVSGAHERVTIHSDLPGLTNDDIERMIREAADMNFEDTEEKERVHARLALDTHVHNRKFALTKPQVMQQLTETEIQAASDFLNSMLKWSNENQYERCEEYICKGKHVEETLKKLLPNFKFNKVGFSSFVCRPDIHSLQEPSMDDE